MAVTTSSQRLVSILCKAPFMCNITLKHACADICTAEKKNQFSRSITFKPTWKNTSNVFISVLLDMISYLAL